MGGGLSRGGLGDWVPVVGLRDVVCGSCRDQCCDGSDAILVSIPGFLVMITVVFFLCLRGGLLLAV